MKEIFKIADSYMRSSPFNTGWYFITPELAKTLLDECNKDNRKSKPLKIKKMSSAMRNEEFLITHQGIAFSKCGVLLDGQNRLSAIVESGRGQLLMVSTGLDRLSQREMDNGSLRNPYENLVFGGGLQHDAPSDAPTIARNILSMGSRVDLGNKDLLDLTAKHLDAIMFAKRTFRTARKGVTAPMLACVSTAQYTVDHDVIVEFARVFYGGHFSAEQSSANALAKKLQTLSARGKDGGRITFAVTQRALKAFVDQTPLSIIHPLFGNVFPIPGDEAEEAQQKPKAKATKARPRMSIAS